MFRSKQFKTNTYTTIMYNKKKKKLFILTRKVINRKRKEEINELCSHENNKNIYICRYFDMW